MIAGLVAILNCDGRTSVEETLERLKGRRGVDIGQLHGPRLPITIEAADSTEIEAVTNWVQELEGVAHVDIVFASFDSTQEGE